MDKTSAAFHVFDPEGDRFAELGLVYSQTSDMYLKIKRKRARLNKLKYGVLTGIRLHNEETDQTGTRHKCLMVTLTYSADQQWCPKHIAAFNKRIRQWCYQKKIVYRCVWVMELTKVGIPHYHLLIWLPKDMWFPSPDTTGWWTYGSTTTANQKKKGYLVKSFWNAKLLDGIPKGARLFGVCGLSHRGRLEYQWWKFPRWVREIWKSHEHRPIRIKGRGWCSRLTGEIVVCPWKPRCVGDGVLLEPK